MASPQQSFPQVPAMSIDVIYLSKWVAGVVASTWVALPITIQALCVLMLMDYGSGFASAKINRTWEKRKGTDGLWVKALTLMLIFACHYVSTVSKIGFDIGTTVAVAFCVNEFASIVENCGEAGVRIPPVVVDFLSRAKRLTGNKRRKGHSKTH